MPTIDHTTKASDTTASQVAGVINDKSIPAAALEEAIKKVLAKSQRDRAEAAQPKEPDWATITEKEAGDLSVYIPVIDHEIPEYMNIKLKDPEYEAVWASKDQRRIGQLEAEGYELLKPEHIHPGFKIPLKFDSEGIYRYEDVIAMRVHKRILYGKRRRGLELSQRQLGNNRRPPAVRVKDTFDLSEVPARPEVGSFYDPVS